MDIWTLLKTTDRPIVFYGTGNGADMMAKILSSYNVRYNHGKYYNDVFILWYPWKFNKIKTVNVTV